VVDRRLTLNLPVLSVRFPPSKHEKLLTLVATLLGALRLWEVPIYVPMVFGPCLHHGHIPLPMVNASGPGEKVGLEQARHVVPKREHTHTHTHKLTCMERHLFRCEFNTIQRVRLENHSDSLMTQSLTQRTLRPYSRRKPPLKMPLLQHEI
jgi:hypothetical protein